MIAVEHHCQVFTSLNFKSVDFFYTLDFDELTPHTALKAYMLSA